MKKFIAILLMLVLCLTVFAACKKEDNGADLKAAKEYLYSMYKDAPAQTGANFERPLIVRGGDTTFDIVWTVEIVSGDADGVKVVPGDNKMATIEVAAEPAEDIVYKLTATIKGADGATEKLVFDHTVPKFKVFTFQEYLDAETASMVVCQGVVTGIISKTNGASNNCLYLQDQDGGYYAYQTAVDPVEAGVKVGMTVRVTGTKDLYNGTHEIKAASIQIIDSNISQITAVDFTEIYTNAAALDAEELVKQQAMLVTLKGVEITGQDAASGYYKFTLGGKESYIRISGSTCPLNKDDQTALINGHSEHYSWLANVTGVICVYSGKFYLTPVSADAFEYVSLIEKTDAEKVQIEKENLSIITNVSKDTTIDLLSTGANYPEVSISWASDNTCAVVADGKLVITMPESDGIIKLTATITCGEVTETKEFEIKAIARELSYSEIVDAAYELAEGEALDGAYRLYGVITSIDTEYSEEYKNITVTIQVGSKEDKKIQCFRLKGEGVENLKVGDAITVEGTLKNYKGTVEFDSGCQLVGMGEIIDQSKIVENAYGLAEGEAMSGACVLKGEIISVDTAYDEKYDNVTVTIVVDGMTEKPIQCFRLKGEGAAELKVGDIITVVGTLKNYKGTVEFDAGCQLVPNDDFLQVRTLLAAYALPDGEALADAGTLTGVITEINTAYSDEYKNITVTIVIAGLEDYKIECFRMVGEGVEGLAVGDTITVTGTLKNYVNKDGVSKIEFDAKCNLDTVVKAEA